MKNLLGIAVAIVNPPAQARQRVIIIAADDAFGY
jgi:hypothetical protein